MTSSLVTNTLRVSSAPETADDLQNGDSLPEVRGAAIALMFFLSEPSPNHWQADGGGHPIWLVTPLADNRCPAPPERRERRHSTLTC